MIINTLNTHLREKSLYDKEQAMPFETKIPTIVNRYKSVANQCL